MPLILLRSPFRGYRGTTDFPHGDGVVVFPRSGRHHTRAHVEPTYTKTPLQAQIRAHLSTISHSWMTVNDVHAQDWLTLANQLSPTIDPDGLPYDLTAQGAFTKINMYRLLNAQVITHDAPDYSHPAAPGILQVRWNSTFKLLIIDFRLRITFTGFCFLEISHLEYSDRRSARKNELRIPDNLSPNAFEAIGPGPTGILFHAAHYRFTLAVGQRRGFRILYLSADYVPGQSDVATLTIAET
ncbi:hypothetical protein ES703_52671 [subsurface metagenome]